jgi:hypothetical protein
MSRHPLRVAAIAAGAAAAAAAAVVALVVHPAGAINSYNAKPAPERTEVGVLLVLWDSNGDGTDDNFDWHCTGAMIDADTFLTAAHCVTDWSPDPANDHFYVSLDQDVQSELDAAQAAGLSGAAEAAYFVAHGMAVEGDEAHDPGYTKSQSNPHDIAVVDFSHRAVTPANVWTFTPAQLPTAGELDALGGRTLETLPWLVAGYGTEQAVRGPGGQTHPGGGARMEAPLSFNALTKTWVRLSMIAAQGNGGACYGDSGGPNFVTIDGTLVLAATTITGDSPCYATNVSFRTDTPTARTFLAPYVNLP